MCKFTLQKSDYLYFKRQNIFLAPNNPKIIIELAIIITKECAQRQAQTLIPRTVCVKSKFCNQRLITHFLPQFFATSRIRYVRLHLTAPTMAPFLSLYGQLQGQFFAPNPLSFCNDPFTFCKNFLPAV